MAYMNSEMKTRVEHWIRTLKYDLYKPLEEISWEAYETYEYLNDRELNDRQFHAVKSGYIWGNIWEYCWFRGEIVLPEAAHGKRIVMNLQPGGESTIFVNGQVFGTYRADWVDEPHHFFEDNVLSVNATAGERYEILMETYAGHYYPQAEGEGVYAATGPVIPGTFEDSAIEGQRRVLGKCTYGIWNETAYQLLMDVDTLYQLLKTLDETSLRAAKVAEALEQFTYIVDFEQAEEGRNASYKKAIEMLKPVMEAHNGSTMPEFYAVGNAHLDLAWLWPMAETYRKTARTFAAQLRLIEEYPDYKFIQSQPASYEMCRKYYPELFEKIKKAIKDGQWIADGAMWVEPDTNMAGGESLIRQLYYGRKYYKEELGVESEVLWLPDTFGYTAALPQILNGCGVKYLVTQKIFWSYNDGERFPYHYFNWKGMDGSKIVAFLPTSYTYRTTPTEANKIWKNRSQRNNLETFLIPYGYGDGGGGPARDFVEYIKRQEDLEGNVKFKMASPIEFFEEMEKRGGPVNTYVGELYFDAHRGTFTTQAMIKKNNRISEFALREMEFWCSLAIGEMFKYDASKAEALWKELLLHQFHDILPGTCIGRVYEEAEVSHQKLQETADQMKMEALKALVDTEEKNCVTIFNSLGFERRALVELPQNFAEGARTSDGKSVAVQTIDGKVKALVSLPSAGALSLTPGEAPAVMPQVTVKEIEAGYLMENDKLRVIVDKKGEIISCILKKSGREFAAGPMNHFRLYKDVPRTFDAWDIDSNYINQETEALTNARVEIVGSGLEAVLKLTGRISDSQIVQYIRLAAGYDYIQFATTIDWKELHRLLKVSFPIDVYAENGINEMQFGYVERPTHRSRTYDKDRFEVCNHRYSALCDGMHGAALLNDCKYGISMNENALELTLLRAAASPEMCSDNRVHKFTYALDVWEGSFIDCDVVKHGYELNVQPQIVVGKRENFCAVQIEKENIILDTLKPAEDGSGDLTARFYESKKASVVTSIHLNIEAKSIYLCDMLENDTEEVVLHDGSFQLSFKAFEIKTIKIRR